MKQRLQWRKAQRSISNSACVEVAPVEGGVMVRDSKQNEGPQQPHLFFTADEWSAFLHGVKEGEFDDLRVS